MSSDIMIDLETLDTSPYCVILTIGVVTFNPKGNGVVERLELRPTVEDQTEIYNRIINDDTLRWWSEQSPEALEEALGDRDRMSLKDCMEVLYKFCWNRRAVWSNGASFDIVACETAMRQTLIEKPNPIPWPFYTIRDTRTIYEIANVKLRDGGHTTSHKAVEDAERQAIVVQKAYKKLMDKGFLV
jgi:hypothetical protein